MPVKFDTREWLGTLDPPEFYTGSGKKYIGRILSVEQWMPFEQILKELETEEGENISIADILHISKTITDYLFPHPRWKFWRKPCSYHVSKLPPIFQMKVAMDFSQAQGEAIQKVNQAAEEILGQMNADNQ